MSTKSQDDAAAFAALADEFCSVVVRHNTLDRDAFVHECQIRLAQLYSTALALPAESEQTDDDDSDDLEFEDTPDSDQRPQEEWKTLFDSLVLKLGWMDQYRSVINPYHDPPEDPEVVALSDDLADIYRDLRTGLEKWNRGEKDLATSHWRMYFELHWGEHAVTALHAMHTLAARYELGFPDQSDELR